MKKFINSLFFIFVTVSFSQTTVQSKMSILKDTQVSFLNDLNITHTGTVVNDGELNLKANLINNGLFTYSLTNTASQINFIGVDQQITGSETAMIYNVLFENNSTALSGILQIDHDANFLKGIVNNRDYGGSLFFSELSDHINTSNESFVNGTVLRTGDLDFTLPIGIDATYRPLFIEGLPTTNSFSSTYFLRNSNTDYPHDKKSSDIQFIDTNEYWDLQHIDGDDFTLIELTRDATTSSLEIMNADLSTLSIVRWDADRNFWVDEGGVLDTRTNSIKTITNVSGYGIYALATISINEMLLGDLVYNNLTPNGDGINDALILGVVEEYPDNVVQIFNRSGVLVSEIKEYNNKDNVFKGYDNNSEVLPSATYYYVLTYETGNETIRRINYLYINEI